MPKIGIISDSTCDLTLELREKHNIEVIPLLVTIGGKTYKDGEDITTKELFKLVDENEALPKTSNASPAILEKYFSEFLEKYDQIIFCGIGSDLSGNYQNAMIAKDAFEDGKVFVVDSKNLSSGIGLVVLKGCKFRDEGLEASEIAKKMEEIVPNVRTQFAINTLKYMHMGGRCSGFTKILAITLKIKPILKVVDGVLGVSKKPIGYNRALATLLEYIENDKDHVDPDFVMVTHSLGEEDAPFLKENLAKIVPECHVEETFAGGVIATHCGPRTIGILYIVK